MVHTLAITVDLSLNIPDESEMNSSLRYRTGASPTILLGKSTKHP